MELSTQPNPRRARTRRRSAGKIVIISPRDIQIFRLLARYRYLPSNFIHAFVGGNPIRFKQRLGELFHEGYLARPSRQWQAMNARYRPAIYELDEKARDKLAEIGAFGRHRVGVGGNFAHELIVCQGYPLPEALDGGERQTWLRELVTWWQLDRSRLDHRISYVHGARLRRYGGKINQIERIITLLRTKPSTRAVAVLVDPFRDFNKDAVHEEFASFCLVEFRRRDVPGGKPVVDAIAFYRAQEFARWWPINVAELRLLQREICQALGFRSGRITTIAADARTISRSPTQVAMPIIDRWLDQAPERLHLLADAIVHRTIRGDAQRQAVVTDWRTALVELETATQAFNPDGIPIPIEGLDTLAAFIEVAARPDDDRKLFTRRLRELARANESFEKSARERADFGRWSPIARGHVEELQRLTTLMLSDDADQPASGSTS